MKKPFEERFQEIKEGHWTQMIPNLLEEVAAEMCSNYCKYPEQYEVTEPITGKPTYDDKLLRNHCDHCPISMIW